MKKLLIQISEYLYNLVLKFYPKPYRQKFGSEMSYVFSESLKDAYREQGEPGIIRVWIRTSIDACKSLIVQHIEHERGGAHMKTITTNSLIRVAAVTVGLLLIPAIGMQFSSEWNWSPFDFLIMGALISITGVAIELARTNLRPSSKRVAIIVAIVLAFVYVWAELAVGIFTNLGS